MGFQVFMYLDIIFCRMPDLKCCSFFAGCLSSHRSLFSCFSFIIFSYKYFICYCCWARRPGAVVLLLVLCWSLSAYRWAPPPTTRNIIIIDNCCRALFSDVPKLIALYNILQDFLSFTNIIHIIMTTNNVIYKYMCHMRNSNLQRK